MCRGLRTLCIIWITWSWMSPSLVTTNLLFLILYLLKYYFKEFDLSIFFFFLRIYFRSELCGGSFCRWSTRRAQIRAPIHMFAVSAECAANRNAPPFDWTETSAEVSGKVFQAFSLSLYSLVETNSVPFLCRKPNGQTWWPGISKLKQLNQERLYGQEQKLWRDKMDEDIQW